MEAGASRRALNAFTETARTPNLRRAQLSFGGAFTSEWVLTVALSILAFRDGGAAAVGLVAMARILPSAFLAPVAVSFVDHYRRENVLAAAGIVRTLTLAAGAVSLATTGSAVAVYVLAVFATLAHTIYRPTHSALLPSLCKTPSQLTGANVVRGLQDSLSALLGPLAAGLLVGPLGVEGVLAVAAALSLWSTWLIGRLDYERPPLVHDAVQAHPLREAIDGLSMMSRDAELRTLTLLFCAQTFTRGAFTVFAVVLALEMLDTGEAGVGVLTAALGVGAVIGSAVASLLVGRAGFARWFGVGIALWGAPFAVIAAVPHEVPVFMMLGIVGGANALVDVTGFTVLNRLVADEVSARFFTGFESLLQLSVAAGSLLVPGLIVALGERGALVAVGLLAPALVGASWGVLRRLDIKLHVSGTIIALLQRTPMLSVLPLATVARLAGEVSGEEVDADALVVEEGSRGDDFYVIARGRAEVLRQGRRLCFLETGDCFGEIAALGRGERTSSVRADTDLRLLRLSGEHFVRAVTGYSPSRAAAAALVEERMERDRHAGAGSDPRPSREG